MRRARYRLLLAAVVLSLVIHFTVVPLLLFLLRDRSPAQPLSVEVVYARSSALRISRETRPRAAHVVQRPAALPSHARFVRASHASASLVRPHAVHPRRRAPQGPRRAPAVDELAQQAVFTRTIAQLRAQENPLLGAARPVPTPQSPRSYTFNVAGAVGTQSQGYGILTVVRAWRDGGYDYYYLRYFARYPDGTTESGIVPWPVRYLPHADPFLQGGERSALPVPLPDYHLPADTTLDPLVAYCYAHRAQLTSCPLRR